MHGEITLLPQEIINLLPTFNHLLTLDDLFFMLVATIQSTQRGEISVRPLAQVKTFTLSPFFIARCELKTLSFNSYS